MKKILTLIAFLVTIVFSIGTVSAAPSYIYQKTIYPEIHNTYDLGSVSKQWQNIFVKNASTTNLSVLDQATGCAQFGSGGSLLSTGIPCGSGSGGSATTTINGASGPNFTFATGTASGISLTISTSSGQVTFTPTVSTSTLAAGLNHNALYNLTTGDVHTQYAYLAGRSGGQTIIGGTASGNNLTLQSTSNATRGKIYLGSTSFYDEATDRLRLGGAISGVQTFKLSLKGDATNAASITLENVYNHQWHFGGSTGSDRFYITKTGVVDYITLDYPADTITFSPATASGKTVFAKGTVGVGISPSAPLHVTGTQLWTTAGWYKGLRLEGLNTLELGGGSGTPWGFGVSGGAMYIYSTNGESSAATPTYLGFFNAAGMAVGPAAYVNSLSGGVTSFHSKNGGIFGTNSKFSIQPDYTGSGDLPAGSFMGGFGTSGSMSFVPAAAGGTAGDKMVLGYYNGSAWKAALEYANTSGGAYTDLYLQKNGGNIAVGTTSAPSSPLTIAYSNTSTTSAIRITGPNGSTEKRSIRFESTGTGNADTILEFNGNTSASGKYGISWFNASSSSYLMFLDKGGNLGIGTTSPGRKLTISDNSNTNGASGLRIEDTASTTAGTYSIVSGSVAIGTLSIRDDYAGLTRVSLASNGNFGVATSTPAFKFSVSGSIGVTGLTSSATGNAICIATNGELINAGGGTCTPSSIKFKENISSLKEGTALETLNKLRAVAFDYKEKQPYETNHSYGVIAEEVEQIDPNLVDYGADGQIYGVHFEKITGLLIQAVQELSVKQGLAKAKRSAEENWQWVAIGLLALVSFRQQLQIRKLTK